MSEAPAAAEPEEKKSFTERMLNGIEKAGNKVPHPVMIFVYLILLVIVLSVILDLFNVNVTEEVIVPSEQAQLVPVYYGGSSEPIELPPSEDPETEYVVQDVTVVTQKVWCGAC
jgi:aminobenzoyl-glutamate transport protein